MLHSQSLLLPGCCSVRNQMRAQHIRRIETCTRACIRLRTTSSGYVTVCAMRPETAPKPNMSWIGSRGAAVPSGTTACCRYCCFRDCAAMQMRLKGSLLQRG